MRSESSSVTMPEEELLQLLGSFQRKKIAVLGDVGVDRYTQGSVERISPEAPVPIVFVQSETLKLVRQIRSPQEIDRLIGQLMAFDRLTPSLILSALCHGNVSFFETALARLSGIAVANARALISDKGDLGFRAIYNKSGLPEAMFPAVRTLLATVRMLDGEGEQPGSAHYANRVVERLLGSAEQSPVDNLSYIIALVRRGA